MGVMSKAGSIGYLLFNIILMLLICGEIDE